MVWTVKHYPTLMFTDPHPFFLKQSLYILHETNQQRYHSGLQTNTSCNLNVRGVKNKKKVKLKKRNLGAGCQGTVPGNVLVISRFLSANTKWHPAFKPNTAWQPFQSIMPVKKGQRKKTFMRWYNYI